MAAGKRFGLQPSVQLTLMRFKISSFYLLMVLWMFSGFSLHAQNTIIEEHAEPTLRWTVAGGYLIGGQLFSESFTYNAAFSGELGLYYPLNSTVNVGVGVGGTFLMRSEQFFPLFASFIGFTKPNRSSNYLLLNAGYAPGSARDYAQLPGYGLSGGPLFKAGFGRRFLVGEHSLMMGVALNHQWAKGQFTNSTGGEFSERLNYDWLAVELRFFY